MSRKFKLGPLQRKWVEALESGNYLQGYNRLHSYNQDDVEVHCCLGVADIVCELNEPEDHRVLSSKYGKLGLRSGGGMIRDGGDLVEMNDSRTCPFTEIAKFIRENASKVFTEPK